MRLMPLSARAWGLQQTRPDGDTRLPLTGATKEGPLAAAGPKKEVKVTRVRAKPKGGRRGPGLCGGHLPSDGEQVGWEPRRPGAGGTAGRLRHGPAGQWHRLRQPLAVCLCAFADNEPFPPPASFLPERMAMAPWQEMLMGLSECPGLELGTRQGKRSGSVA